MPTMNVILASIFLSQFCLNATFFDLTVSILKNRKSSIQRPKAVSGQQKATTMASTFIAILLASVVIFWHAPFFPSLVPPAKALLRRWRAVVWVILLLALITTQSHTSPAASFSAKKAAGKCQSS
jgi:hypothetical protein